MIGAYYYLKIVKIMYFDEPGDAVRQGRRSRSKTVLIALAALIVSPLGYLAHRPARRR